MLVASRLESDLYNTYLFVCPTVMKISWQNAERLTTEQLGWEFIKERFKKTPFRPRKKVRFRKKERKHAFDQEKRIDSRKKERKHAFDQEKK